MASSGSVTTNSYSGGDRTMTLSWNVESQSVSNNTSTIQWTLKGSGSETGWVKCGGFYVEIGGNVVCNWSTDTRVQVSPVTVVASGTITLSHNTDGTKSFSVVVQAGIYNWERNCSGSGTFTLNTIARASSVSISNGGVVLGTSCNVGVNSASSEFTHTLIYKWGSLSGTIADNVTCTGWKYTAWTPSKTFAEQIPSATIGYGTITCTTYKGSSVVGSKSISFYGKVGEDVIPTVSSATATADNSACAAIAGWGLWVAGYTKAHITAEASGIYGSTINSFVVSGGTSANVTGSSLDYTSDTVRASGSVTFSVTAKDSRGRTSAAVATDAVTVYPYSTPTITSFIAHRNDSTPTKVIVKADWSIASVNSKNSATATLQYKQSGATSWTTCGTIAKNTETTLSTTFSESSSYTFRLTVTDAVGNSAQMDSSISTGEALLDFRAGGKGLGIGKMSETDNLVDINESWNLNVHGSEILDLIDNAVPTKLSELTDDSTHRLVTDTQIATWNASTTTLISEMTLYSGYLTLTAKTWTNAYSARPTLTLKPGMYLIEQTAEIRGASGLSGAGFIMFRPVNGSTEISGHRNAGTVYTGSIYSAVQTTWVLNVTASATYNLAFQAYGSGAHWVGNCVQRIYKLP